MPMSVFLYLAQWYFLLRWSLSVQQMMVLLRPSQDFLPICQKWLPSAHCPTYIWIPGGKVVHVCHS